MGSDATDAEPDASIALELPIEVNAVIDLLPLGDAIQKVNAGALQALVHHFNGEMTSVRAVDAQDCLF